MLLDILRLLNKPTLGATVHVTDPLMRTREYMVSSVLHQSIPPDLLTRKTAVWPASLESLGLRCVTGLVVKYFST